MLRSKRLSAEAQLRNATSAAPLSINVSKGEGVKIVQRLLADLGFKMPISLAGGAPDGQFGRETEAAVKLFQQRQGLKPDGFVGPLTLQAMDNLIMANPDLLELLDFADAKSRIVIDASLPLDRRGAAYW